MSERLNALPPQLMKQITLIGDSIRMGYTPFVADALAGEAEIWGPVNNGGPSGNVLSHLDEWILTRTPAADVVHVNAGLHDLKKDFESGRPQASLAEYEANVRQILSKLRDWRDRTGAPVIWATMTPVNEQRHHATKGFDRFEADVADYNAAAVRVARELDVPVNDLFAVIESGGRDRLLGPDGVHFTAEGYKLLARAVVACVQESLRLTSARGKSGPGARIG
jgi:lysophospholipase L1-like esterase